MGDPIAGDDTQRRFLPTRLSVAGDAIDEAGEECRQLACPACHGTIHDALLTLPTVYLSIFGAPQSGKSFFLGAMLHQFESIAASQFGMWFKNIDPVSNSRPSGYAALFEPSTTGTWVTIPRTQPFEADYHKARINGQDLIYPAPYIFQVLPRGQKENARASRVLCLYDVAGETFLPGFPADRRPLGNHLALSKALLFVLDPTLQPGFRTACAGESHDPQLDSQLVRAFDQSEVLSIAAERIRLLTGKASGERSNRTLIVIVNKFDAWSFLLGEVPQALNSSVYTDASGQIKLDLRVIERVSQRVRHLLERLAPKVVTAAESAFANVLYIPVTATGGPPELVKDSDGQKKLMFRQGTMTPRWVHLPALCAMHFAEQNQPHPLVGAVGGDPVSRKG